MIFDQKIYKRQLHFRFSNFPSFPKQLSGAIVPINLTAARSIENIPNQNTRPLNSGFGFTAARRLRINAGEG